MPVTRKELLEQLMRITDEEQKILDGEKEIDKQIYMEQSTNEINSKLFLKRGKLITVRTHTRFIPFPAHTHDYIEVVYMCAGSTTHIVNGTTIHLQAGELLFLNQHATQSIEKAGLGDVAINFIILPEFFDETLKHLTDDQSYMRDFLIGCIRGDISDIPYIHFHVGDVQPVQNLVENMILSLMEEQVNRRSILQMTMTLLVLQLINCTDRMQVGREQYYRQLEISVLGYIESNYRDGSLTELAAILGCDIYWLSRKIKQITGHSYLDLVQIKRLNQAAFLLRNTRLPVCDISAAIGYENSSYFNRIFKKRFHCSPGEYRKQT